MSSLTKMNKTLLLLVPLFIYLTIPSWGTTYFVSESGDDDSSGTDYWSNAWATIEAVNSRVSGGDTVFFGSGIYRGRLDPVSGTAANPTVYACSAFTEGIASIWGSDLVTGWENHSGYIYKVYYPTVDTAVYMVGQLDDTYDTLLTYNGRTGAMPDDAGEFYHADDTLYVWLYGDGDPAEDSITIEVAIRPCVRYYDENHTKIWGFKLRYGSGSCIKFDLGGHADSNYIEHCHFSRAAGGNQANTSLIYSGWTSPNADSSATRWGNVVRACSLMGSVFDVNMDSSVHRFGLCFYSQWGAIVESCYVAGEYYKGIKYKSDCWHSAIRHNYIEMPSGGNGIALTADYTDISIYGNVIVGNGVLTTGIGCRAFLGSEYKTDLLIVNNTMVNCSYNGFKACDWNAANYHTGDNRFKYNIVYLVPDANDSWSGGICKILWNDSLYWTLDSNMYYVQAGDTTFQAVGSGTHFDLATWRSRFGWDSNTVVGTDPAFNSTAAGDFRRPLASNELGGVQVVTGPPISDTFYAYNYGAYQNDYNDSLGQVLSVVDTTWSIIDVKNDYILIDVTVDTTEYQWSTDNFSSFVGKDAVVAPQNPDTIHIGGLEQNTTYQIRAISWDTSEGIVDTSSTLSVRTLPIIPTPDTLGTIIDSSSALAYASAVDAGMPVFYEFELDTLINFPAPELVFPFSVTDTVIASFGGLISGVEYCWRVRAVSSNNTSLFSDWSSTATFSLGGGVAAGEECIGIFPPEGATIDTLTPTFEASCEDANNYIYFQVDDNVDFDSPIESGPITIAANNTAIWEISQPLSNEKIYYWRAGIDNLEWFSAISFGVAIDMYAYPVPFMVKEGHSNITFTNLPEGSHITIMTVSENIVKISEKVRSGGNWIWDVKNARGNELAPGVYLYAIEFPSGTSRGKLMVIR
ncbi:MAG: right-handed parallel beta-helix repeat-containing protein [Candidatus Zixiibacteriota bacterium]|nr:MAG: right-handed parallel beta-helix repeat-containing protein [candidate division Zixibacteria bacterium]